MSTTIAGDNGAHILVFPYPLPGHIIPLLDLTRLLLTRGLTITLLVTPTHRPLLEPLLSSHPSSSIQALVLDAPTSSQSTLFAKIRSLGDLYNPILHWFQSHPSPPLAIISDFFLGWTHNLACQLGVPRLVFWPSGACVSLISTSLWLDLPKRDDPTTENSSISFPNVPNSPICPWWQLPDLYRFYKEGDPDCEFFRNGLLANTLSWGVVFNSFCELEGVYIDHVKKEVVGHDRVWAVGPLLPSDDDLVGPTMRGGSTSVPTHEVMSWLDTKADESVVYVCFGSYFVLTSKQMDALAAALECSGVHFIWCVKADDQGITTGDAAAAIPDGFEDRVDGRGFVIRGWAPQVVILRHRAVGVFVTHCGWNSTLEGLTAGVMMLTWPMGADQFFNAHLLVEQFGVAARVCEGGSEIAPDSPELAHLLAESVGRTRPERAQVKRLREAAIKAVKGGSSHRDLDELVKQLSELKRKLDTMTNK